MSIIVGIVDKDNTVHMGCDSAATDNVGNQQIITNHKVFFPEAGPWFLIGVAGTIRHGQLLRYSFLPPLPPAPDADLEGFMATEFIDAMRKCLGTSGFSGKDEEGREIGGWCLVGYQGRLFFIEENFQVVCSQYNYDALGSGSRVAIGSLYSTEDRELSDRMELALNAAAEYNSDCRPPFLVHSLPFSENHWEDVRKSIKKKKAAPRKPRKKR